MITSFLATTWRWRYLQIFAGLLSNQNLKHFAQLAPLHKQTKNSFSVSPRELFSNCQILNISASKTKYWTVYKMQPILWSMVFNVEVFNLGVFILLWIIHWKYQFDSTSRHSWQHCKYQLCPIPSSDSNLCTLIEEIRT